MRIAICSDFYPPQLSGVADSIDLMAEELRAMGHEVRIYAPKVPGCTNDPKVFRFPSWPIPGSAGVMVLTFPFGGMRDMKKFKPEVIHAHTFSTAGLFGMVASRRLGVPFVATDHTSPADYMHYFKMDYALFKWAVRKFSSWFHARARVVTAPSQHILDELREYGMRHNHAEVVSNAVRTDVFRSLENKAELKKKYGVGEKAVLLFGRIAIEKNLAFAADVFSELVSSTPTQLIIVGGGPYEEELKKYIEKKGLTAKTKFLGVHRGESLIEVLNTSDIFFTTSTSEIQPMATLQAMACELPVVAARAGGLPECVIDGDTGFLVEPTDLKTYVEKLKLLLEDDVLCTDFGRAGRDVVRNYSPREIAHKFELAYDRAVKS